ncbi:AMP phosphorylase [archaeon]|jgi:putative thymidine phosphorylase|nr:AMP phosphorylase [archaeon]MBT4242136.1 AMP phosphorylase [archaeon]MBT4417824.1 AMP phosphorylase [archaeon]
MKLRIKKLKFLTGKPVCMIHENTAKKMSWNVSGRVLIKTKQGKSLVSIVDTVSRIIKPNQIAVSETIINKLNLKANQTVEVELAEIPRSIELIKKKLEGKKLTPKEIKEIITNIANNSLSEVETAFFVSAVHDEGMNLNETKALTQAMVDTGETLKLAGKVVDKHSIGGVAGNRTTPIIVAICATAGLIIPKTSSRAITSASGTADTMECITPVDFSIKEIKSIIKKTNACLVWGGALGLAPVDDKIIKIERVVNIDSTAQLLASILSKKISVGSKYILIDIPYGKSAKVSKKEAKELKRRFLQLSKKFKLKLDVILTDGSEPIGDGIGPALEMKDILKVLGNVNPPLDLREKSILLAGRLLELAGKTKKGNGKKLATEILTSGKAYKKFEQIVKNQKGSIKKLYKLKPKYSYSVKAETKSKIKHIDNKLINRLARHAGCPEDKASGIFIHKKKNQTIQKNDKILTIYTTSKEKLNYAKEFYKKNRKKLIEYG